MYVSCNGCTYPRRESAGKVTRIVLAVALNGVVADAKKALHCAEGAVLGGRLCRADIKPLSRGFSALLPSQLSSATDSVLLLPAPHIAGVLFNRALGRVSIEQPGVPGTVYVG